MIELDLAARREAVGEELLALDLVIEPFRMNLDQRLIKRLRQWRVAYVSRSEGKAVESL